MIYDFIAHVLLVFTLIVVAGVARRGRTATNSMATTPLEDISHVALMAAGAAWAISTVIRYQTR